MTEKEAPKPDSDEESEDPIESWEEGFAFGVSEDSDPLCETPVEDWISGIDIESTAQVPIPEKLNLSSTHQWLEKSNSYAKSRKE